MTTLLYGMALFVVGVDYDVTTIEKGLKNVYSSTKKIRFSFEKRQKESQIQAKERRSYIEAFPRFARKYEIVTENEGKPGDAHLFLEEFYDGRTSRTVDYKSKKVKDNSRSPQIAPLVDSPLSAIGLRLYSTFSVDLSDMISSAKTKTIEGEEILDGSMTVRLRLEGIPRTLWAVSDTNPHRPRPAGDASVSAILWLSVENDFLPKRWAICGKNEPADGIPHQVNCCGDGHWVVQQYDNLEWASVPNNVAGGPASFPLRILVSNAFGSFEWILSSVELNPKVIDSDFQPALPVGFVSYTDKGVGPGVVAGGIAGYEKRLEENVAEASKLLQDDKLVRASAPLLLSPWGQAGAAVLALAAVLLIVAVWRRRSRS